MRKRFEPTPDMKPRVMRKPPIMTFQLKEELRRRQERERIKYANDRDENRVLYALNSTGYSWNRKIIWGHRLYDFWCADLGVVVQIDRPDQNDADEAYWDEYVYRRSGIIVLRVDNGRDLDNALAVIARAEPWSQRRERNGRLLAPGDYVAAESAGQRTLGF